MKAPTVRLRLSKPQVDLILPALRHIVAADRLWRAKKALLRAGQDIRFYEKSVDASKYKVDGMEPFHQALKKLSSLRGSGGRVRLEYLELATCMKAARETMRMLRHKHLKSWLSDHKAATKELLTKLELYRKRARYRLRKTIGLDAYRQASQTWAEALTWADEYYLWCPCNQPKQGSFLRRRYQGAIDLCMELAAEGLKRRCCSPPDPEQLRVMVRGALRSARRLDNGMPLKYMQNRPIEGGDYLADFIIRTRGKQLIRFDISTTQAGLADRLAHLR